MTEYNGTISNLLQGVSQQARLERRPEQLESQVNSFSSVTKGLGNRPGTQVLTHGSTSEYPDDAAYYTYDRGDTLERYSIVVDSGSIKVTDLLTGIDRTVDLDGLGAYLTSSDPENDFRFYTIADTTFILNKSIEPTMSNPTDSSSIWQSIVYCKKASWGFDYKVISNGTVIGHCRTPATVTLGASTQDKMITLKTTDIIQSLWKGVTVGNAEWVIADATLITGITQANPGAITVTGHAFEDGDVVNIRNVVGMTELNDRVFTVTVIDANTIHVNEDTTGYTAYVSGGIVAEYNIPLKGIEEWASDNGVTASMFDDVIHLEDTTDWGIETEDANNGNDMLTFGQSIDHYSNLPRVCYDGYKVKVEGVDQTIYNDYYVAFSAENGSGIGYGVWKETAGFGVNTDFDPETMPHILTREADDSFLLQEVPWVARSAGDDNTNPAPSFVGTEISDIMTYQGRLVLVSEENVVASVTFDHYNLFAPTVTVESSSDPIDTASSDNQVTNLHHGLVFNSSLVLFSDRAQFLHGADVAFTTDNFGLSSKSRFKNIIDCRPVASATSVFFPFQSGQFTGIREMQIDSVTGNLISDDISAHVDHYIPGSAKQLESSTDYNILVIRPGDDQTSLYVFQWFNQEGKRKQAAWHKWEFSDTIQHIALVQDTLYIWKQIGSVVSVEYIDLADTDTESVAFPVRLDHQDSVLTTSDGDYWKVDATAWVTTRGIDRDDLRVVAGDDTGIEGSITEYYDHPTDANAFRIPKVALFPTGTPSVIVGSPIEAEGQITNPYVRSNDGIPKTKGRLRLGAIKFNCSDTGSLNIVIEKDNAPTYTKEFDARIIDNATFVLDTPPTLIDVEIKAAVRADANRCRVKYYSDSHLPFYISNIDWYGAYYETGRRTI